MGAEFLAHPVIWILGAVLGAAWLSRMRGVTTTAGKPVAEQVWRGREVTNRPHRTGCRHPGSTQAGSVTSSKAASTSPRWRCHATSAALRPPDWARI